MSRGPEARLIASVNRLLPKTIYHQAMGSLFCNGTPDQYYEGPGGCVWIEYKKAGNSRVSALQQRWHDRAVRNNVNAWIVFGGGVFSKEELARAIEKECL